MDTPAPPVPPITHQREGHKGAFVIAHEGKRLAEMTYSMAGSKAIIDHTTVDDALRGTGAGGKLVEAAVQWARAENLTIIPLCPYAKSVFDRTPAYADVLAT
jgi:predicted GNAT family acetyltransferase